MSVQALPEFPAAEGDTRPMTFRKVLLNTCQEEFEGTHEAREVTIMSLASTAEEVIKSICLVQLPQSVSLPMRSECGAGIISEYCVSMQCLLTITACARGGSQAA